MNTKAMGTTLLLTTLALGACDDGTGPGFNGASDATLSFAVPTAGAAALASSLDGPAAVIITDADGRTLDVQRILVVMEEIELKRAMHDHCDDDDACEYFEAGPVLLELPVEGGVITPFDVAIPADTYSEIELEIDDADDDSTSGAFFAANPGWPREASMRIVGTFDANDGAGPQAFDVFLEVDAEIEQDLVPPLVVTDETQDVNVTILIDVATWFRASTGSLIDPRALTASADLLEQVEDNIENSFEAFEDDDRDGDDDEDDDGDDDDGDDDSTDLS